jgi:hypothetical protein
MALQLEPTANKVIKIYNTDIELTSVYLRFKYDVSPNGRIVICNSKAYQDKAKYQSNSPLAVSVPLTEVVLKIDVATETADMATVHTKLQEYYQNLGYTVTILDI